MRLYKQFATNNECYKIGRTLNPIGIFVHSTGANNPNLKRYVQPDDGRLGINPANNHFNTYRPGGRQVCVHAFIGRLKDGSVATYQTLPWTMRGWHGGKSYSNNNYIGFEICEDNLTDRSYFNDVYKESVELCAYLCKMFNFNPLKDGVILCHSEGASRGIASNHGDVMHWFPKHGKDMDMFRNDVYKEMKKSEKYEEQKEDEIDMTKQEFINSLTNEEAYTLLSKANAFVAEMKCQSWAKPVWDKATNSGLVDGSRPESPIKRTEFVTVLDRLGLVK